MCRGRCGPPFATSSVELGKQPKLPQLRSGGGRQSCNPQRSGIQAVALTNITHCAGATLQLTSPGRVDTMDGMLPEAKLSAVTTPTNETPIPTSYRTAMMSLHLLPTNDRWKTRCTIKRWSAASSSEPRVRPPGPRPQRGGSTEHWPRRNGSGPGNVCLNLTFILRTVSSTVSRVFRHKGLLSWCLPGEDQFAPRVRVSTKPTCDRRRNHRAVIQMPMPHRPPARDRLRPSTDRQLPMARC